jgi:hypothetical protein
VCSIAGDKHVSSQKSKQWRCNMCPWICYILDLAFLASCWCLMLVRFMACKQHCRSSVAKLVDQRDRLLRAAYGKHAVLLVVSAGAVCAQHKGCSVCRGGVVTCHGVTVVSCRAQRGVSAVGTAAAAAVLAAGGISRLTSFHTCTCVLDLSSGTRPLLLLVTCCFPSSALSQ